MDLNDIITKAVEIIDRKETKVLALLGLTGIAAFGTGYSIGRMIGAYRQREKEFDSIRCSEQFCCTGSKQEEMERFLAEEEE